MYQLPCPEPMSKLQILEKAHQFWLEYIREVGPEHVLNCGISFDEVFDAVIYPHYEITLVKDEDLGVDDFGDPILGRFLPKENTALVAKNLFESRDYRQVFTEWHEVAGHGVLQGEFLRKNASTNHRLFTTAKSMNQIENAFEQQANTFAANVAAPLNYVRCILIKVFGMEQKIRYCGPCKYSLCYNNHNSSVYASSPSELAWKIAKKIQHYFWGLSAESLAYQVLDVAIDHSGYERGTIATPRHPMLVGSVCTDIVR